MASKRPCGPPTGTTPKKPPAKKGKHSSFRKSLTFDDLGQSTELNEDKGEWKNDEIVGLIQYVALFGEGAAWPSHKKWSFWEECGVAIQKYSRLPKRSATAVRRKAQKLAKLYKNLDEAEDAFDINYFDDTVTVPCPDTATTPPSERRQTTPGLSPMFQHSPLPKVKVNAPPGHLVQSLCDSYSNLSLHLKRQLILHLMKKLFLEHYSVPASFLPNDFVDLAGRAMHVLQDAGKDNILYHLAVGLGKERPDGSGPRLRGDRMPFGLLHHNIMFFAVEDTSSIRSEVHYTEWQTTMFAHFGHKWDKLFRGPMWSFDGESEGENEDDVVITGECEQDEMLPEMDDVGGGNQYEPAQEKQNDMGMVEMDVGGRIDEDDIIALALHETEGLSKLLEEEEVIVAGNTGRVSTLWSGLNSSERIELQEADTPPEVMEEIHNLRPQVRIGWKRAKRDPLKAKINVAGLSSRHLQRKIQQKGFSRDTNIQISVLETARQSMPKGNWWIKADACDIRSGLMESLRQQWSGDVDMGDGKVKALHKKYLQQLQFIQKMGLKKRREKDVALRDLECMKEVLKADKTLLTKGLSEAKKEYEQKRLVSNTAESVKFALAWEVTGYETLITQNAQQQRICTQLMERLRGTAREKGNTQSMFFQLRKLAKSYTKDLYGKMREAASHLLIFMIAEEQRASKPYAVPVRVLPYKSITDARLRELRDELKAAMESLDMEVIGFVTDGEFNSLRTQGSKRPVSVIQLMMNAKKEARAMRAREIEGYLKPVLTAGGQVSAAVQHPAVPQEDLEWLYETMQDGNHFCDVLHVLRRSHFPLYYDPHPWIPGKIETHCEKLKSLMATYLYRNKVNEYHQQGINFADHLYVPENNSKSGKSFHEREDHNHVLKRITSCARAGSIPSLDLRFFRDALHDAHTGLTYEALTGKRKQSVPDCEKFFSVGVLRFMEKNNHGKEADIVRIIFNWHKAADGRGIDEEARERYCDNMLNWLLDDWMPWHKYHRDFSSLDVNRPIKGIQGLTREVVVALVANIESRKLRRIECLTNGLPPENPRASTTDDVEGLIALLHLILGKVFDHKSFLKEYPKIMNEFNKRIDPDLPFFYWTGIHERYHMKALPSFNAPSGRENERLDRVVISRRADPGVFVSNRASLPQRGSTTVRAKFHACAESIPPRNL